MDSVYLWYRSAPPAITNLTLTKETDTSGYRPQPINVLTFDPITDTGGLHPEKTRYLLFESPLPITSTDHLTAVAQLPITSTATFKRLHRPRPMYYAVQAEDGAENRGTPDFVETEGGKVDLVMIIDDSSSMNSAILSAGITGARDLVDTLVDGDRLAIRDIASVTYSDMPLTLVDAAARGNAKSLLGTYSTNSDGSPMEDAILWAIDQFKPPAIANDDRPHVIIAFSDGDQWQLTFTTLQQLKAKRISVFVISGQETTNPLPFTLQQLASAGEHTSPPSRLFADPDTATNFAAAAKALRSRLFQTQAEDIPPGETKHIDYPIDPTTPEATIQVSWEPSSPPPFVTLTAPDGRHISPAALPSGAAYQDQPGLITYTLLLPPLPHGMWTIHIENNDNGGSNFTAAAANPLPVQIETSASSTVTSSLRLDNRLTLELALFDSGQPITDTTFVWSQLVDAQGVTQTLVLHDDGLHNDRVAKDGYYATPITGVFPDGIYPVTTTIRHFNPERGYLERTFTQDFHFLFPRLDLEQVHWKEITGNHNGSADPGETIALFVTIANNGNGTAYDFASSFRVVTGTATLQGVPVGYSALSPGNTIRVADPYTVTIDPQMPANGVLALDLALTTAGLSFHPIVKVPLGLPHVGAPLHVPYTGAPRSFADINTAGGRQNAVVAMPFDGLIGDVNLSVDAIYTSTVPIWFTLEQWNGHARAQVSLPPGTRQILQGATFDDYAEGTLGNAQSPFTGAFRAPSLTNFDGAPRPGQWVTNVTFEPAAGSGTLNNWEVILRPMQPICAPLGNDYCIRWNSTDVVIDENRGEALLTVTLSPAAPYTITVGYRIDPGTAAPNIDYVATGSGVTFAPGQASQVVRVPIRDDTSYEIDETLFVHWYKAVNERAPDPMFVEPTTARITIRDNDPPPLVTLSATNYNTNENSGNATLTARLNVASSYTVTVEYTTADGSATQGNDYTATSGTVTFAPGQTSKTFTIPILEDGLGEGNETFSVSLRNPINAVLGTLINANVTIYANDTITFGASSYNVHENGGNATITVRLNAPSAQSVSIGYATSNGTATAGSDYTTTSGTLTFNPGETSKTFTIPILEDTLNENNETVTLTLNSASNAVIGTPNPIVLTINANDSITFGAGSYTVHENAGNATITVKLNAPSTQPVSVNYATSNGTATAGSDYTTASGTLTFNPGETSKTFTVPILEDMVSEVNETVNLTLSSANNAVIGTPNPIVLTINANDSITLGAAATSVHENAGKTTITVKLNAPSAQTVTVNYSTANGSATAGSDYTAASGTVTFAPGQTSKTVDVPILEDSAAEGGEAFSFTLSSPNNAGLGTPSSATVTINANDSITFSGSTYSVNESAGQATITIKLNAPSAQVVTVQYTTVNGSATAGSDYTTSSGTITFNPGETSKTFTILITNDTIDEPNETVTLNLSNPTNAALGATATATLTIVDND